MNVQTVYAVTTATVVALTRVLALKMVPKGTRVNAIAPGWIMVDNLPRVLKNFDEAASASTIPASFNGKPWDLGRLAIFLASDDARCIIGQTLTFDGGQSTIMPLTGYFREPRTKQLGRNCVPYT
jgi:3-oxoacyl-[acyl-carrier protein] reductase